MNGISRYNSKAAKLRECRFCGIEFEPKGPNTQNCSAACSDSSSKLYAMLRKYGLSRDDYSKLRAESGGKCRICDGNNDIVLTELCVDHDHYTGQVRGLLCNWCNLRLGRIDDILWLYRATFYASNDYAKSIALGGLHQKCIYCERNISGRRTKYCADCVPTAKSAAILFKYGLTWPRVVEISARQRGICALCDTEWHAVDHDHTTGVIRGLLCRECNARMMVYDNVAWMRKALDYLFTPKEEF